jgi:hypothetical protein
MKRTGDRGGNRMGKDLVFSIPLPYGLFYVRDSKSLDDPEIDGKATFWRTDTVLAVACQGDEDGPTEIRIGNEPGSDAGLSLLTSFDMSVPSRRLLFETVPDDAFHEMRLERPVAHVEVWTKGYQGTPVVWLKIA